MRRTGRSRSSASPGAAPGQFNNPWGVALDSAGNLYVADSQNHRVQKLIAAEPSKPAGRPESAVLNMNFQFTHPYYLLLLHPGAGLGVLVRLEERRSAQPVAPLDRPRSLRVVVLLALIFAMAGLQWLRPVEGMNVFFVLDRSDSIPSPQQEAARDYVNQDFQTEKEHR